MRTDFSPTSISPSSSSLNISPSSVTPLFLPQRPQRIYELIFSLPFLPLFLCFPLTFLQVSQPFPLLRLPSPYFSRPP
jgi:hypothetical protein